MKSQTYETTFDVPKQVLIMMASNPALISGLLGHISILQAYDPKQGMFVTPDELTSHPTRFKVAYIFGTPDSKTNIQLGEMEGPLSYLDSVTYKGFTYDGKMKWEISFSFKELSTGKTKVSIIAKTEEDRGLFGRLLGRNQFSLAEHAINAHIIPFIKLYMNQMRMFRAAMTASSVEYRLAAEEEGIVSEVMAKLIRLAKESNANYAIIVLQGEGFRGKVDLKDGKPVDAWFRCTDGSVKTGKDAVLEALSASVNGKAQLYIINIDTVLENISEQIFSDILKKEINET